MRGDVVVSRGVMAPFAAFSGPEAAHLAGITYRQLDYWARRGWIVASQIPRVAVRRRVYTADDIVRLAALGHLGRSRVDVATYAEAKGRLALPSSDGFVIVWAIKRRRSLPPEPSRTRLTPGSARPLAAMQRGIERCLARRLEEPGDTGQSVPVDGTAVEGDRAAAIQPATRALPPLAASEDACREGFFVDWQLPRRTAPA